MFNLDELEKNWQEYYRTKYGKDHLSNEEIAEYLVIDDKQVSHLKNKVNNKIKKDTIKNIL